MSQETDGRGQVTTYDHDRDGRLTSVTDPMSRVVSRTTWSPAGRPVETVDARGTVGAQLISGRSAVMLPGQVVTAMIKDRTPY